MSAIGIFDSGLGGLTVASAVHKAFPQLPIVYLGDTARLPYGNKSPETVRRYALNDSLFLIRQKVSAIVVACNTASAFALDELQHVFRVPIIGVIEPGAEAAAKTTQNKKIGVIGTKGTISSQAYDREIKKHLPEASIYSLPTPLLVPLIEENYLNHEITKILLKEYMSNIIDHGIDTLVLGCTHYPLIKGVVEELWPDIKVIDSAIPLVSKVKHLMEANSIGSNGKTRFDVFVTDYNQNFITIAKRLSGNEGLTLTMTEINEDL